ncbi:MAG: hypothetical protein DME31_07020 [Verrucomicrobia bacterium]|nr:MAG: hypothetical protein DMC59_00025 [Verrucomicrobiota bacterium]PYL03283.1 MAG: hypothetical protein DME31_07020 [Verrucomicrobiota bacterium]PYL30712.1 MAG: hypothetical protein DMF39_04850 [Verrucomicrobiota bacterium]
MVRHILEVISCKRRVPLRLAAAIEWLKRTRFKCLLVMTLLCLGLRENYPFSNFPMYSSFTNHTSLLYLTDAQGTAVSGPTLGLQTSALKKIFDTQRRTELKKTTGPWKARVAIAEQIAGEALLGYLDRQGSVQPQIRNLLHGLRVQQLTIHLEGHDLVFETQTLATHE